MSEQFPDLSDDVLGRRLATELPRHAAPSHLRSAILAGPTPAPARSWWVLVTNAGRAARCMPRWAGRSPSPPRSPPS